MVDMPTLLIGRNHPIQVRPDLLRRATGPEVAQAVPAHHRHALLLQLRGNALIQFAPAAVAGQHDHHAVAARRMQLDQRQIAHALRLGRQEMAPGGRGDLHGAGSVDQVVEEALIGIGHVARAGQATIAGVAIGDNRATQHVGRG